MALAEHFVWDEQSFLVAWEAGAFGDQRVELVEGEVLRVVIGDWHGEVTMALGHYLRSEGWIVTGSTLPASGSLPDPDAFVRRADASAIDSLGTRVTLSRWRPDDIGLVVEVAQSSFEFDTVVKARVYGRSGYATYWVVHPEGVEVFTEPYDAGYRLRRTVGVEESLTLPYAPAQSVSVAELVRA